MSTPTSSYPCKYCGRVFLSARGCTQHINAIKECNDKQVKELLSVRTTRASSGLAAAATRDRSLGTTPPRRSKRTKRAPTVHQDLDAIPAVNETEGSGNESTSMGLNAAHDDENSSLAASGYGSDDEDTDPDEDPEKLPPNKEMVMRFHGYTYSHEDIFLPLSVETKSSIKLMDTLRRKKAPLDAYQEVMEWHLKETGVLKLNTHTLRDTNQYFTRNTLISQLGRRYNMEAMFPKEKKVRLPFSKSVASIPYRDAKDCLVSLLTDPRIKDSNYRFFDDDPLAPPPKKVIYLEDLQTGDAYLKSYEKMITKKGQVLLPVPIYIDGAVTGQFSSLPITAVKIALGILDRDTRDKGWAWRELGFIPQVRKERSRGKKLFKESKHMESQDMVVMDGEGDTADEDSEDEDSEADEVIDGAVKAQDFHTMLRFILKSFVELQRTGFVWDLVYKGKLYKDIEFVIFVPFVKCDTEEADLLCGKFLTRTRNIKHICRYCYCPTAQADDPRPRYRMKTQAIIQKLCERNDVERLKAISQQPIKNAWYDVTFHAANGRGIHGACPSEMLHAVQLGVFKYLRDIFFDYMGESSRLADDIDGLAKMYCGLLTHQSDRDIPKTNFSNGIRKGKLMAKEYRGVLLVMAAVLRSTEGQRLLMKKKAFGGANGLRDWTVLVELLLEWEAYLNEKKMLKTDVHRLDKKNRYIMYIMLNVAMRHTGMGLKVSMRRIQTGWPGYKKLGTYLMFLFARLPDHEVSCHYPHDDGHASLWCSNGIRYGIQ